MSEDAPDPDDLRERIEALAERLEGATVETDFVEIEEAIETLEDDLEALEAETDDEEVVEALADEVETLAGDLEEERGPYAEDVLELLEAIEATIEDSEWTEPGEQQVADAVSAFAEPTEGPLAHIDPFARFDKVLAILETAREDIVEAELDPDEDADTLGSLFEASQALEAAIDDAETWDDLTVREKLEAKGFYDILAHRKDFPPEWSAVKAHEQAGNIDMILLALDLLDSEFMEENCIESLKRLGHPDATEMMLQLSRRRNRDTIEVLGYIGAREAVEMLVGFVEEGPDRPLEMAVLQALGRIGDPDATQTVANRLVAEDPQIRSVAARMLGMIGDTRAIDPLIDALDDDAGNVRGSAAWALNEIGTREALEAVAEYAGDREYLVEVQAARARETLDAVAGPA